MRNPDWADRSAAMLTPFGKSIPPLDEFRENLSAALRAAEKRGYNRKAAKVAKEKAKMDRTTEDKINKMSKIEGKTYRDLRYCMLVQLARDIDQLRAQLPTKADGK